jgi:hypothetical protein
LAQSDVSSFVGLGDMKKAARTTCVPHLARTTNLFYPQEIGVPSRTGA